MKQTDQEKAQQEAQRIKEKHLKELAKEKEIVVKERLKKIEAQQKIEDKQFDTDKKKILQSQLEELRRREVDLIRVHPLNPFSVIGKIRHELNSSNAFFIWMQKKNGYFEFFIVYPKMQRFIYNGGSYLIDDSKQQWLESHKMNALMYHENCCLPFEFKVDITELQKKMRTSELNVRSALNPMVLAEYLKSDVIKTAISGSAIFEKMMLFLILLGVNLVFVLITMVTLFFK